METWSRPTGGVELIVGVPPRSALRAARARRPRRHLRRAAPTTSRSRSRPAGADELEELLLSLRGAGVLTGARGRAPVDVRAAAEAAAALSRVAAAHPEIAEIEINPLLVTPAGAVGLDARIVLRLS